MNRIRRGKRGNGKKGKRKRKREWLRRFFFPFTLSPLPPFFLSCSSCPSLFDSYLLLLGKVKLNHYPL
jgi:hypothetical protein